MDAKEYRRDRAKQARKAIAEFKEHVNTDKLPEPFDRLITYMVTNMGFNTVMDQEPNWLLGHMSAFARKEVKRALRACR